MYHKGMANAHAHNSRTVLASIMDAFRGDSGYIMEYVNDEGHTYYASITTLGYGTEVYHYNTAGHLVSRHDYTFSTVEIIRARMEKCGWRVKVNQI